MEHEDLMKGFFFLVSSFSFCCCCCFSIFVCKGFLKWKQYFSIRYTCAHIDDICLFFFFFSFWKEPRKFYNRKLKTSLDLHQKNKLRQLFCQSYNKKTNKQKTSEDSWTSYNGDASLLSNFCLPGCILPYFCSMLTQSLNAGVSWLSSLTVFCMSEFA